MPLRLEPAVQSDKEIVLYTGQTPSGFDVRILLEELKGFYGKPEYEVIDMVFQSKSKDGVPNPTAVSSPWYLEINPNGLVPAITHGDFSVFETSAILLYLAQQFDQDAVFSWNPADCPKEYSEMVQWLAFAHGGLGPSLVQIYHLATKAKQYDTGGKILAHFNTEVKHLYSVLESRLQDPSRRYLAGPSPGKLTLADFKTFPWVYRRAQLMDNVDQFPNLKVWSDRIAERPAVKIAIAAHVAPSTSSK